jgi:hypothetical protein
MADRTCPGCGMNDDHPRHILVTEDGTQRAWHTDCHQLRGCEICDIKREDAGGLIGDEYRGHLLANKDNIRTAVDNLTQDQLETAHGTGI